MFNKKKVSYIILVSIVILAFIFFFVRKNLKENNAGNSLIKAEKKERIVGNQGKDKKIDEVKEINSDLDEFMISAIKEAKKSLKNGGIPIGSVLVKNGKIIGRGHNRRVQDNDPLAHAEMVCLKDAGRIKKYKDTVIYSTLMPCYMCAGTIVQFGIKKVVVCESDNFEGAEKFLKSQGVEVIDLNNDECKKRMKMFIEKHPDIWYEDIGK